MGYGLLEKWLNAQLAPGHKTVSLVLIPTFSIFYFPGGWLCLCGFYVIASQWRIVCAQIGWPVGCGCGWALAPPVWPYLPG